MSFPPSKKGIKALQNSDDDCDDDKTKTETNAQNRVVVVKVIIDRVEIIAILFLLPWIFL